MPSLIENCGELCALHRTARSVSGLSISEERTMDEAIVQGHANELYSPSSAEKQLEMAYRDHGLATEHIMAAHACVAIIMRGECPMFQFTVQADDETGIGGQVVER